MVVLYNCNKCACVNEVICQMSLDYQTFWPNRWQVTYVSIPPASAISPDSEARVHLATQRYFKCSVTLVRTYLWQSYLFEWVRWLERTRLNQFEPWVSYPKLCCTLFVYSRLPSPQRWQRRLDPTYLLNHTTNLVNDGVRLIVVLNWYR